MVRCFRVVGGVGEARYATISPGVISDSFGPARRNNALTVFYVAIPVGAALGYVLGGKVAFHFGWRHAFLWAGLPGLLLALALLPFREPDRGQAEVGAVAPGARPRLAGGFGILRLAGFHLIVWGYVASPVCL